MERSSARGGWFAVIVAVVGALTLTGCREDERDRVMMFEQGVYKGAPDSPLAPEQVDDLRSRARQQQF